MTNSSQSAGSLSLSLTCGAIQSSNIATVEYIRGEEAISTPYVFEVTFTTFHSVNAGDVIGQPIALGINAGTETLAAHGIVLSLFSADPTLSGNFVYRIVVVPRLKLLDLNQRNQVFGTQSPLTVPNLITQLLGGQLDGQCSNPNPSQPTISNEQRIYSANYPSRDFLVQYGESDLAFLSRRCEAAGIFYFFEQPSSSDSSASETVIFGDSNVAFTTCSLNQGGTLPYSPNQNIALASDNAATSFCALAQALPTAVYLNDYNDQTASVNLVSNANVASNSSVGGNGFGNFVQWGQDYSTPTDGSNLATIRAQEIACRGSIFRGISTAPQLRPGYLFTLSGHHNSTMNVQYVVTKISHRAGTPFACGQDSGVASENYHNEFEAIPFSITFRPKRVTPQPLAAGLFSATVDSSGNGQRADIDQYGRYKLRLLYDESTSPAGSASTYVRKAAPYSGKNDSGMDFPLLKDTEVVVSFVNGDPDRPIIVGAAPNSNTPDVVSNQNSTRNRIKTTSAVLFEIEDGTAPASGSQPSNFARLSVPGTATSYLRLGVQADSDAASPASASSWGTGLTPTTTSVSVSATSSAVAGDSSGQNLTGSSSGIAQQVYDESHTTTNVGTAAQYTDGIIVGTQQNLITDVGQAALTLVGQGVNTQVTNNDHTTTVSAGAFNVSAAQGVYITGGSASNATNIVLEAYGYVKTKSHGNEYIWSHGDSITQIDGDKTQTVVGSYTSTTIGPQTSTTVGVYTSNVISDYNQIILGGRIVLYVGGTVQIQLALSFKLFIPGEMAIYFLINIKIVFGLEVKMVTGVDFKWAQTDVKLISGSTLEVQPQKTALDSMNLNLSNLRLLSSNLKAKKDTLEVKNGNLSVKTEGVKTGMADILLWS